MNRLQQAADDIREELRIAEAELQKSLEAVHGNPADLDRRKHARDTRARVSELQDDLAMLADELSAAAAYAASEQRQGEIAEACNAADKTLPATLKPALEGADDIDAGLELFAQGVAKLASAIAGGRALVKDISKKAFNDPRTFADPRGRFEQTVDFQNAISNIEAVLAHAVAERLDAVFKPLPFFGRAVILSYSESGSSTVSEPVAKMVEAARQTVARRVKEVVAPAQVEMADYEVLAPTYLVDSVTYKRGDVVRLPAGLKGLSLKQKRTGK